MPIAGVVNDLDGVQQVWALTPDDVMAQIADADVVYGWPTLAQFQAARQLKWIQIPSAGVEMVCSVPQIVEESTQPTDALA